MRIKIALLVTLCLVLPFSSFADEVSDLKKRIILDQKKLNIMEYMTFSNGEAENFWPLYNEYQERLFRLDLARSEMLSFYVANYRSLTDQQATEMIDGMFDVVDNRQAIMKKLTLSLEEILPAKKVYRYLQVENNIAAIEQYDLVKKIPLLE